VGVNVSWLKKGSAITKNNAAKKTASAIVGASGEHYVAGYLSGLSLIVAMPRAGIPGCDLLISS
jgi:hypothetical protein